MAVRTDDMFDLPGVLEGFEDTLKAYRFGEVIHLVLKNKMVKEGMLVDFLKSKGHTGITVKMAQPSIEDCFMDLMQ